MSSPIIVGLIMDPRDKTLKSHLEVAATSKVKSKPELGDRTTQKHCFSHFHNVLRK